MGGLFEEKLRRASSGIIVGDVRRVRNLSKPEKKT